VPELIVTVDVPFPPAVRVTVVGFSDTVRPLGADDPKETAPVNPWREARVIVEARLVPWVTVMFVGLALSVKSWMVNVVVVEWESDPLIPITTTV
jgi:hypothetical protein